MNLALVLVLLILTITTLVQASEEPLKEVLANEILGKIKANEPVEYNRVIIKGALSLDGLGLPIKHVDRSDSETEFLGLSDDLVLVRSPIRITNSMIDGRISLRNTLFNDTVDFSGTQFESYTDFSSSQFKSDADFYGAQFDGITDFFGSQFESNTDFSSSQFEGDANFVHSQFGIQPP